MDNKIFLFLLAALLVISFFLRLIPLQTSHWWDEAVYLQHSEIIFSGRSNFDEFNIRPPMLPMLFAFSYIFNHHIFTPGVVVAFLGTLGVFFLYILGKEIYNKTTGLLAALFFGLSPFIVTASHWIMTDIPSLSFLIIGFYTLVLSNKNKSKGLFFLSGILFSVATLTRFTSIILLFVAFFFLRIYKIKLEKSKYFVFGFILSLLPYLIWVQIKFGFFLSTLISANFAVGDFVSGPLFYITGFLEVYPIIVPIGILLYLITFSSLPNKIKLKNMDKVLILWALIFLLYISLIPHKEARYILPIAAPIFLLAAKGFDFSFSKNKKIVGLLVVLMFILLSIFSFYSPFQKLQGPFIDTAKSNEVIVSEYLKGLNSTDIIYSNQNYPVYAYYTGMRLQALWPQDKTFYDVFPKNMEEAGFFILYRNVNKEPNFQWLESSDKFTRLKEFGEIIIFSYKPK